MTFEWDAAKATKNLAKHGISFPEAALVFADPRRLTVIDSRHTTEHRENTTGLVAGLVVVSVTHTDRSGVTRIISARPASRQERKRYHAQD
ncbi:BrnT family toxin [Synoicihabitans lomoniglobus]|uniref:BrnT family toxin n=1 Tax=Synoicihabitans lomoniglobus TaxID=2909285 RepID=A0AAE9ZZK9_9BACT|nr:BrnT family toxin [Opitutaceae bacterium LMO-M01]WED64333.1 BrnT family toxin [Opitutaceae bacterium LMO-M01]